MVCKDSENSVFAVLDIIFSGKKLCGEMAERLKAVASKAIVRIADRGFESLSLRHPSLKMPGGISGYGWQAIKAF